MFRSVLIGGFGVCAPVLASAAEAAVASSPAAQQERGVSPELRVSLGAATFLYARSLALEHRIRPLLRASLGFPVWKRLTLGPGIALVLDPDTNYGVWGAFGAARYGLIEGAVFELGVAAGAGIGYDAPILHTDLQTDGTVLPYGELSFDATWKIGKSWALGVELGAAQISVVHLSSTLSGSF